MKTHNGARGQNISIARPRYLQVGRLVNEVARGKVRVGIFDGERIEHWLNIKKTKSKQLPRLKRLSISLLSKILNSDY